MSFEGNGNLYASLYRQGELIGQHQSLFGQSYWSGGRKSKSVSLDTHAPLVMNAREGDVLYIQYKVRGDSYEQYFAFNSLVVTLNYGGGYPGFFKNGMIEIADCYHDIFVNASEFNGTQEVIDFVNMNFTETGQGDVEKLGNAMGAGDYEDGAVRYPDPYSMSYSYSFDDESMSYSYTDAPSAAPSGVLTSAPSAAPSSAPGRRQLSASLASFDNLQESSLLKSLISDRIGIATSGKPTHQNPPDLSRRLATNCVDKTEAEKIYTMKGSADNANFEFEVISSTFYEIVARTTLKNMKTGAGFETGRLDNPTVQIEEKAYSNAPVTMKYGAYASSTFAGSNNKAAAAFDGDFHNTYWESTVNDANSEYLIWMAPEPIAAKSYGIINSYSNCPTKWSLSGSSDMEEWVEVSERRERTFWKTRILAMKCAKWLQT